MPGAMPRAVACALFVWDAEQCECCMAEDMLPRVVSGVFFLYFPATTSGALIANRDRVGKEL